jgi:hypothetical protein
VVSDQEGATAGSTTFVSIASQYIAVMSSPFITGKGPEVVVVSLVFLFIAYLVVALRLWSRQIVKRPFHVHDYLIGISLLLTTGVVVCLVLSKFPLLDRATYELMCL